MKAALIIIALALLVIAAALLLRRYRDERQHRELQRIRAMGVEQQFSELTKDWPAPISASTAERAATIKAAAGDLSLADESKHTTLPERARRTHQ